MAPESPASPVQAEHSVATESPASGPRTGTAPESTSPRRSRHRSNPGNADPSPAKALVGSAVAVDRHPPAAASPAPVVPISFFHSREANTISLLVIVAILLPFAAFVVYQFRLVRSPSAPLRVRIFDRVWDPSPPFLRFERWLGFTLEDGRRRLGSVRRRGAAAAATLRSRL